jgi:glutamyl-Q tRNA(Asp) synthetase
MSDEIITRFAPSPTGHLHLGHAYAALYAEAAARNAGGRFLLRIEDIDGSRVRPEFEQAIFEDLTWLGLNWEMPVRRQSDHLKDYCTALESLRDLGVVYPCFCTRAEIRSEIARSPSAPHGPYGPLYPGNCKNLGKSERTRRLADGTSYALRLDVEKALLSLGENAGRIVWSEANTGQQAVNGSLHGDVVIARKDTPTSYHLSVTVDDALQGITLVTRGLDLMPATHIHRLLQELLHLPPPKYHHHRLITDEAGQRLATRDKANSLRTLRDQGMTPDDIRRAVGIAEE